jgi:DNA-binding transcriptional MocR family regulator
MDPGVDSLELFRSALEKKIAVMPGIIFASGDSFKNCIRISCGMPYSDRIDQGLQTLAGIVRSMVEKRSTRTSA